MSMGAWSVLEATVEPDGLLRLTIAHNGQTIGDVLMQPEHIEAPAWEAGKGFVPGEARFTTVRTEYRSMRDVTPKNPLLSVQGE